MLQSHQVNKKRNYYQEMADAVRKSTVAQTAYTPGMVKALLNIPVEEFTPEAADTNFAGFFNAGGFRGNRPIFDPTTVISRRTLQKAQGQPVDTLQHENLHAVDSSAYRASRYSTLASSRGFSDVLKKYDPVAYEKYMAHLKSNGYDVSNKEVVDIEMFAYYGQQGSTVLLKHPEIAKFYSKLYLPASKALTADYMYSSSETIRSLFEGIDTKIKTRLQTIQRNTENAIQNALYRSASKKEIESIVNRSKKEATNVIKEGEKEMQSFAQAKIPIPQDKKQGFGSFLNNATREFYKNILIERGELPGETQFQKYEKSYKNLDKSIATAVQAIPKKSRTQMKQELNQSLVQIAKQPKKISGYGVPNTQPITAFPTTLSPYQTRGKSLSSVKSGGSFSTARTPMPPVNLPPTFKSTPATSAALQKTLSQPTVKTVTKVAAPGPTKSQSATLKPSTGNIFTAIGNTIKNLFKR